MKKFLFSSLMTVSLLLVGCATPVNDTGGDTPTDDTPLTDEGTLEDTTTTPDTTPDATTTPDEKKEETTAEKNEVYASAQKPGKEVAVEKVVLAKPGFVVIHKDSNNQPGDGAGASQLLTAGETVDVKVVLTEEAKAGEWYWAMLHTDDGNGTYEFPGPDAPITDEATNIVMVRFEVKE